MAERETMRINGFEQIKGFYSWMFSHQDLDIKPQHTSLYMFLVNQNNRNNWVEWFKVPYDLGMTGSCISSKKTYYACLNDLQDWGLVEYEKGVNTWKAPRVKLEVLKDTATVPLSEPLPTPLDIPLPTPLHILQLLQVAIPLPTHNIKLLTNNIKPITDNIQQVLGVLGIEIVDQENEAEKRRPDEKNSDYINELVAAFGFTEMRFAQQQKKIFEFVNVLSFNGRLEHFKTQHKNYLEFKKLSGQTSHAFSSFLGTIQNKFEDGAWNSENWEKKLEAEKLKSNGKSNTKSGTNRSANTSDGKSSFGKL